VGADAAAQDRLEAEKKARLAEFQLDGEGGKGEGEEWVKVRGLRGQGGGGEGAAAARCVRDLVLTARDAAERGHRPQQVMPRLVCFQSLVVGYRSQGLTNRGQGKDLGLGV